MLVAAIGAATAGYELMISQRDTQSCIERGILKAKCHNYKTDKLHIERKELNGYLERCLRTQEKLKYPLWTTVFYGPIGCGKSVAVREALKHQQAVVDVTLTGNCNLKDDFVTKVLHEVLPLSLAADIHKLSFDSKLCMLKSALRKIREKQHTVLPTFLIDVCGTCQPDDLYDLMHLLKHMVHRECLAQASVILSPWFDMRKTMIRDIRAVEVHIGDLSVEETKRYLLQLCDYKQLKGNKTEKEKVVDEVALLAGNRLLYLSELASELQTGATLEDLRLLVHKRAKILKRLADSSLFDFLSYFEQSKKLKKLLQKLLIEKKVPFYEFDQFLKKGTKREDVFLAASKLFEIDSKGHHITITSRFVRQALEEQLAEQ